MEHWEYFNFKCNGLEFCRMPAGPLAMGDNEFVDENPRHVLDMPCIYWIAGYPFTNARYAECAAQNNLKRRVGYWQLPVGQAAFDRRWSHSTESPSRYLANLCAGASLSCRLCTALLPLTQGE